MTNRDDWVYDVDRARSREDGVPCLSRYGGAAAARANQSQGELEDELARDGKWTRKTKKLLRDRTALELTTIA